MIQPYNEEIKTIQTNLHGRNSICKIQSFHILLALLVYIASDKKTNYSHDVLDEYLYKI